jgi:hypothetical protein
MPLPQVQGWMIDYRTAHTIFASQSNVRINHCVARCQAGQLHVCHHEEGRFRDDALLVGPFINDQCCIYEPEDDIYERCPAVRDAANGKPLLVGSDAVIFITATALARQFGVISDHFSPRFATVHDLCAVYGIPALTADQYFALA